MISFLCKNNITRNHIILRHSAICEMYDTIMKHSIINILHRLDCNTVYLGNSEIIMKHYI